jgi:hypothetical protein
LLLFLSLEQRKSKIRSRTESAKAFHKSIVENTNRCPHDTAVSPVLAPNPS